MRFSKGNDGPAHGLWQYLYLPQQKVEAALAKKPKTLMELAATMNA